MMRCSRQRIGRTVAATVLVPVPLRISPDFVWSTSHTTCVHVRNHVLRTPWRRLWHKILVPCRKLSSFPEENTQQTSKGLGLRSMQTDKADGSMAVVRLALIGNLTITAAKFAAYMYSSSSAMLAEAIHSLVDSLNQALLVVGLMNAGNQPDKTFQYGYGRSVYFWSLISALGTFFLGAGVSLRNSLQHLVAPSIDLSHFSTECWAVLAFSFLIDGWILTRTIKQIRSSQPPGISFFKHLRSVRDPTTQAVFMEDAADCIGVVVAITGVGVSQLTGMAVWDSVAGVGISVLLGGVGLYLARLNQRYLLGHAVDPDITEGIRAVLLKRPAIDAVHSVQSQWLGPTSFAYKAEVDFDGTYLAAKLLNRYQDEFLNSKDLKEDLRVLLAWYAEDVTRTVEREVREVEAEIRARYPEAMYIELEPDSKERDSYAIDNMKETRLRRIENDTINQMLAELRITKPGYGKSTQEAPAKHANPETSMEKAKK